MVSVCFRLFLAESHLCTRPPWRMLFHHSEAFRSTVSPLSTWRNWDPAVPITREGRTRNEISLISCPCNPQMLCIWNFFLGFRSWVSTPQCLQECTHGLPGRFFPQKVQTLQWYSWWMGSQNLRVQCFPWVNSRVTGSGQSTPNLHYNNKF